MTVQNAHADPRSPLSPPYFSPFPSGAPSGQLGAANGAGNTLAAATRTVGPLITGGLWAIAARDVFKDDMWLPFVVLAGVFGVTLAAYVATGLKDADMGGGKD